MKNSTLITLLCTAMLIAISGCQVRPAVHGSVVIHDEHSHIGIMFSDSDRRHIHSYYQAHQHYYRGRKGLPPGLAKRERLPPGLAKREQLPPGLYGHRLPYDLDRRLSRLPEGVIRIRIGTDIVLVDRNTRVILDVVKDIPLD